MRSRYLSLSNLHEIDGRRDLGRDPAQSRPVVRREDDYSQLTPGEVLLIRNILITGCSNGRHDIVSTLNELPERQSENRLYGQCITAIAAYTTSAV
jgi:hypothetical protein